ncbi:kinase-like domain-containing protein [Nemania abortiva]|nr:kinase-like domain-containing protein [Nemania abortiva]
MDQLRSSIKKLRRKNDSSKFFFPEMSLFSVMTENGIRLALADSLIEEYRYQQEEVVQEILQRGRKIFGTLVVLGCVARLPLFIRTGLLEDAKLPFQTETLTTLGLSEEETKDFEEKKWELISPTFSRGALNKRLGDGVVLPFMKDQLIGQGNLGKIYEVELDPSHQSLGDIFPRKVARKAFELHNEKDHQQELRNLAILNHLKHPNILELLGSYTYGRQHNLLFPLAEMGSLASLLDIERASIEFLTDESLAIVLAALASAVKHVYSFSEKKMKIELIGCHHDLRPRNILVFGSSFILADFGLSTFKEPNQDSATPFKPVLDDYLAPECEDWEHGFKPGTVTRASDVWSLGCIIAEVATYIVFGPQGIKDFREARRQRVRNFTLSYFHQGPKQPNLKVADWLSKLKKTSVPTCILLALVAQGVLRMEPFDRPNAKAVTNMLRLITICVVAETINTVFDKIQNGNNSLDMFLEDARFDAWRKAIGILHLVSELALDWEFASDKMQEFDAILDCLLQFRQHLEERLSRDARSQHLELSRILKFNDNLHYFLDREQKATSLAYFNVTVLEGDDDLLNMVGEATPAPMLVIFVDNAFAHLSATNEGFMSLNARVQVFKSLPQLPLAEDIEGMVLLDDPLQQYLLKGGAVEVLEKAINSSLLLRIMRINVQEFHQALLFGARLC